MLTLVFPSLSLYAILGRRARREGVQRHQPGGGLILGVLGQQEALRHDTVRPAATKGLDRHLRVWASVRRLRW